MEDARGRARVTRGARRSTMPPSPVMSMNRRHRMDAGLDGYLVARIRCVSLLVLVKIDIRGFSRVLL